jgi:hypothetical protein
MGAEVRPDLECYACLCGLQASFALESGQPAQAQPHALRLLAWAETRDDADARTHYSKNAYEILCWIARARAAWDDLLRWSRAGEMVTRDHKYQGVNTVMHAWQALAFRQLGDERAARRVDAHAAACAGRLGQRVPPAYYAILADYHTAGNALERALDARQAQLAVLSASGEVQEECDCRLHCLHLRARLGLPLERELEAARHAAARLRDPARMLAQIDRIERGEVVASEAESVL